MSTRFWWGNLIERNLLENRFRWEYNIKTDLQEVGWWAWTGLICVRIGTGGGLL
jgi:hypothetical protein